MKTNVYIDGFNLYYGALRPRPQYKWLDLQALCDKLLVGHRVNRIRYFTVRVSNTPQDAEIDLRQQIYLRALATLPKVVIHYGNFRSHDVRMPLAEPSPSGPATVLVRRTEEKGSDVNLASYLLLDCFENDCDEFVVVSNDSDFAEPIRIIRDRFQRRIGVVNPNHRNRSVNLQNAASWSYSYIPRRVLRDSQLPLRLADAGGDFRKPDAWRHG